ncbi:GroES-like protein [Xylona heveae TC161]|uniref:GroES-like protein n=1 Tax=Xylona heveae (strain CBS 132557 / TC161) TaxID=1328760 RepID=A0A165A290_XYLHT|nr:GroES-like protein [Xylona heveae TC161]KZF19852.1 GroES-like protein [Xylona heveae TC161]
MANMGSKGIVKALMLHAAKDLRLEDQVLSPPGSEEVQVAVQATGLCGSDLHYFNHFRNGDILVREPLALGHESAGVVVDVGSSVTSLKVGDRVALEVGLPCGRCERCSQGRYNICKEMKFRSSAKAFPHFQGTLQEKINHPAAWCHKLPDNVSLELGGLLEPLGVAIHACRRAQLPEGSKTLVFGAGAVGILCAATAKTNGSKTVIIADIDPGRVEFAVVNGFATHGFVVPRTRGRTIEEKLEIAKDTAASIAKIKADEGNEVGEVDTVFECTGVEACAQASIYATRPGGRVMLIGMGTPIQQLPISAAALREVDLLGSFRYANTYSQGIEMFAKTSSDGPDFSKLVTHRFRGLEQSREAFEMAGRTVDDDGNLVMKVMLCLGA